MVLSFKHRYRDKWLISSLRERFIHDYLNWLLVRHGFIIKYMGLGAGSTNYIHRYYSDVSEAMDFAIYMFSGKLVDFLDVTGYCDPISARIDAKRCIGSWKLEKARRMRHEKNIPLHRIWFAHFTGFTPYTRVHKC